MDQKLIKRTEQFLENQKRYLTKITREGNAPEGLPKNRMARVTKDDIARRGNIRNLYKILKRDNPATGTTETVIAGCLMCGALKSTIWRHLFGDSKLYDNPFLCNRCYGVYNEFKNDIRLVNNTSIMKVDQLLDYLFDYQNQNPNDPLAGTRNKYVLRPLVVDDGVLRSFSDLLTGNKKTDKFITAYNYKAELAKTIFQNFNSNNMAITPLNYDYDLTLDSSRQANVLRKKKINLDVLKFPIEQAKKGEYVVNVKNINFLASNAPFSNETHYTPYGAVWVVGPEGKKAELDISSFGGMDYERYVVPPVLQNFIIPNLPMYVGAISKTDNTGVPNPILIYDDYLNNQILV